MTYDSPLIIIGMHRSGTTMVTSGLERLGWFPGRFREENEEAWFQYLLNRRIMSRSGGRWDDPLPTALAIQDPVFRSRSSKMMRRALSSPAIGLYLGAGEYLRHRKPSDMGRPWGWKDPRNTFTLPLWLDIYPRSRILHVARNGIDVANSLMTRHLAEQKRIAVEASGRPVRHRVAVALKRYSAISSLQSLEGAVKLWDVYLAEAARTSALIESHRYLEIKYESILENPHSSFEEMATFAQLEPTQTAMNEVCANLDRTRSNAWQERQDLRTLDVSCRALLERWGY